MKKHLVLLCLGLGFIFGVSGCATYYKVVDPDSNKAYYTDNIRKKDNGAIQFQDQVTKSQVTLAESEILEIPKDEYKANLSPK